MSDHSSKKKQVEVTSGPFYVAPVNTYYFLYPVPNNKIVITLKNPTHKKLSARVTLGICQPCEPQVMAPSPGGGPNGSSCHVEKVRTMEQEINLGWHKVDPMSCLRLEKFFPDYELGNSVLRVSATGDFKVDHDCMNLLGGLLEISSVVGFFYTPGDASLANLTPAEAANLQATWIPYTGLTIADASTFIPYGDYVVVDDDSHSSSSSSSSSCD